MLLHEAITLFLEHLRSEKRYSEHTARNYRIDLKQFVTFLYTKKELISQQIPGAVEIDAVSTRVIREFLGSLHGKLGRTSIARKLASVRSLFLFLEKQSIIAVNPAADVSGPKLSKAVPSHLTVDDTFRLMTLPDVENPLGLRDRAMLEVLYSCGIRASELTGMNMGSIDSRERLVKVTGKGNRERLIPVGKQALAAVKNYIEAFKGLNKKSGWGNSPRGSALY